MNRDTILVLKGASRYNVLRVAADNIAQGFREKGYQVEILDLLDDGDMEKAQDKMLMESYAFIFSLQALYFNVNSIGGRPFVENINAPYIAWIVDDLVDHVDRIQNQVFDHTYLFFVDVEMSKIASKMYPQLKNLGSLLHGGFTGKEDAEKDIDVLLPGSLGKEPVFDAFVPNPMPIEKLLAEETIKQLNVTPTLSVRKALELVLNRLGEELSGDLLQELHNVITYVDSYIRYQCRYRIIEALLKNNIKLYVVGNGRNELLEKYKENITICDGRDIKDVVALMQRSKIVLNPVPNVFYKGSHERVFTAMLNKSICFTPYSEYEDALLGDRINYIDMKDLQSMADCVKEVVERFDSPEIQNKLNDNYEYALANHTWELRGQEIIDFYESIYSK